MDREYIQNHIPYIPKIHYFINPLLYSDPYNFNKLSSVKRLLPKFNELNYKSLKNLKLYFSSISYVTTFNNKRRKYFDLCIHESIFKK